MLSQANTISDWTMWLPQILVFFRLQCKDSFFGLIYLPNLVRLGTHFKLFSSTFHRQYKSFFTVFIEYKLPKKYEEIKPSRRLIILCLANNQLIFKKKKQYFLTTLMVCAMIISIFLFMHGNNWIVQCVS